MFQFPALAHHLSGVTGLQPDRLSHSEIFGLMVICTYPKLIAAYHVLHRLQEPRHPPYALHYFRLYCSSPIPPPVAGLWKRTYLFAHVRLHIPRSLFYVLFVQYVNDRFNPS